ncbi:activator-dependent family glycosyltransferase [Streptomyces sp. NBC_01615]|uniref:activator-dependent family glycosyltransferase n=1 Tax=Streptomyces sp. NBC_01615 TaxID=2975898 RepID=UPI003866F3C3
MRVLITTMPAPTHLTPNVPLAWALHNAGHEVRVVSHPSMVEHITSAGLTAVPAGENVNIPAAVQATAQDERLERITEALGLGTGPDDADKRGHIRNFVLAAFTLYYSQEAVGAGGRAFTDDLIAHARAWQPDLVLWDPLVLASPIAARACGAAHARVLWGLDRTGWLRRRFLDQLADPASGLDEDLIRQVMQPTLDRLGHEFDEELLTGQWTIDLMPPRLAAAEATGLRTIHLRRVPYAGPATVPDWLSTPPERPRICLTLGASGRTFFQENHGISIAALLEMLGDLDVEVVATFNSVQLDKAGSVPANVRTVDYIPLGQLLPTCSAIIHHGGGGTYAAAAAHKVPQIVIPKHFGDFLDNARYVAERGAGVLVDRETTTMDELKKQILQVLTEPSFQDGAADLYEEALGTPGPGEIVPVLERLAREHRSRTAPVA